MHSTNGRTIHNLTASVLGEARATWAMGALQIDAALLAESGGRVSRGQFAMALNVLLFADLLERVPSGASYVEARLASGQTICFDHGAIRTIRFPEGPTGGLPAGQDAFARILEPLGYEMVATYPLPALRMTGRAWRHRDLPEAIPQFFVSELHVERFDEAFAATARRVFGTSRDPLDEHANRLLAAFLVGGDASLDDAVAGLPSIAAAFGRHHAPVRFDDYRALLAQSAEAAWIATEGNAFNHATDRVEDVEGLAAQLKAEGRPMKQRVEVSACGRVRQTALRADKVRHVFADGVAREVPGSFYEFISRSRDSATGRLDLSFDSGNATGIFAMTKAA